MRDTEIHFLFCLDHHILRGFSFTLLLREHKSKRTLSFWRSPDRYRNGKTTNEYSKVSCSIGQNSTVQNKTAHPRTAEGITVCNVQYNSVESSTLIFNSG